MHASVLYSYFAGHTFLTRNLSQATRPSSLEGLDIRLFTALIRNTCTFLTTAEKLEVLSELVNPINVTNQTFIMKHRPVTPGWTVARTSVAMCTCTGVGRAQFNLHGLLLSFMLTYEF